MTHGNETPVRRSGRRSSLARAAGSLSLTGRKQAGAKPISTLDHIHLGVERTAPGDSTCHLPVAHSPSHYSISRPEVRHALARDGVFPGPACCCWPASSLTSCKGGDQQAGAPPAGGTPPAGTAPLRLLAARPGRRSRSPSSPMASRRSGTRWGSAWSGPRRSSAATLRGRARRMRRSRIRSGWSRTPFRARWMGSPFPRSTPPPSRPPSTRRPTRASSRSPSTRTRRSPSG